MNSIGFSAFRRNFSWIGICFLAVSFSGCQTPEPEKKPEPVKPNIVIIVADDLGFSDIAPFGGNIQTPVISQLAKEGISFSEFRVLPTCSPTRSALLTGNDNHVAGIGIMSELDYPALHAQNLPGYSGHLTDQVATLPELLKEEGYHTYMIGKWHLGEGPGQDPHDRGFEESFILTNGGGSHYKDKKALAPPQHMLYTRNGKEIDLPEDFYSSRNYTDSIIQFIDRNKSDQHPFFAYLAYTGVHDPLHAPKEYIDKYKGKFDMGWDSLYALRVRNLQDLGIVPKDLKTWSKNPAIPAWNKLPAPARAALARDMEVYAAMLEYLDMSIGRVLDYLKKTGAYDNSLVVFMSDNGANGADAHSYPGNGDGKYLSSFNNGMDNRGLPNSYVEMGPGWAQASTAPFRLFKTFTTEGGIRAPLIVKMPGQAGKAGTWNSNYVYVTDLMPTILELTGTRYPQNFRGKSIHPLIGKSILPILKGDSGTAFHGSSMGYELFEMKAYIRDNWKILRLPQPFGSGQWQLYDLSRDPGETKDLSKEHPDIARQLIDLYGVYVKENQVYDHKGHFDSVYRAAYGRPDEDDD